MECWGAPLGHGRVAARHRLSRAVDRGSEVVRVVDLDAELGPGADDEQVFTYAMKQGYVVLSSDERALWRPARSRRTICQGFHTIARVF